jgi:5-methylcytosine-specific restriction endonuclease McrA
VYCGRTAWGVYSEKAGAEPPRTLRFEIDHRTPRRKMAGVDDSNNLVVACRSCNTIKGEMTEERFLAELRSLAAAADRKP